MRIWNFKRLDSNPVNLILDPDPVFCRVGSGSVFFLEGVESGSGQSQHGFESLIVVFSWLHDKIYNVHYNDKSWISVMPFIVRLLLLLKKFAWIQAHSNLCCMQNTNSASARNSICLHSLYKINQKMSFRLDVNWRVKKVLVTYFWCRKKLMFSGNCMINIGKTNVHVSYTPWVKTSVIKLDVAHMRTDNWIC